MNVERRASVIVCDDILFGLTGKVFLQGVYTTDITIPGGEISLPQLAFYFTAETSKKNPFKKMVLRVIPPGMPPTHFEVPIEAVQQTVNPDRPKTIVRAPLLMQQILLKPGKIETSVITEFEELDAGGVWIMSVPKFPSSS